MAVFKLQHSLDRVVNRIDALESVLTLQSVSEQDQFNLSSSIWAQLAFNWTAAAAQLHYWLTRWLPTVAEMSSRAGPFHATECHFQMALSRVEWQDDGLCDSLAARALPRVALRQADTQKVNTSSSSSGFRLTRADYHYHLVDWLIQLLQYDLQYHQWYSHTLLSQSTFYIIHFSSGRLRCSFTVTYFLMVRYAI